MSFLVPEDDPVRARETIEKLWPYVPLEAVWTVPNGVELPTNMEKMSANETSPDQARGNSSTTGGAERKRTGYRKRAAGGPVER